MREFIILSLIVVLSSCKKEVSHPIQVIESPSGMASMQPYLFASNDELLMSWTEKINDSVHSLHFSSFLNNKWTTPVKIVEGDNWFVNWADFPAIAKKNENLLVHFLQKSDAATYAYDVKIMQSNTNGNTWTNDYILHTDSTKTEHGFVSVTPYKDDFFITWLDGRNTGSGGHSDSHTSKGAMNIRVATLESNAYKKNEVSIDLKTCECCQTSAAITENGPIIVYRDRSDDEIRDISISRFVDGSWTIPSPVFKDNWKINGCPVNGPKAVAYKNNLAVAWFTAANNQPKVKIAFSSDNGREFNEPIEIDSKKPIGRVDVLMTDANTAIISWMESLGDNAALKIVKISNDGTKGVPLTVTKLSAKRASGFPQMELVKNKIYFAWNHIEDKSRSIKMKRIAIAALN